MSIIFTAAVVDKRLPANNFGSNLQSESITNKLVPRFTCNYCKKSPEFGKARYLCLSCLRDPYTKEKNNFTELCENCMKLYLNGDSSVVSVLLEKKHASEHQLWVRILYNLHGSNSGSNYNYF